MKTIFREPFTTLELEIAAKLAEEYGGYWVIAPQVSEIDLTFCDEYSGQYSTFERVGPDKCWVPTTPYRLNHRVEHIFHHVFYDRSAE